MNVMTGASVARIVVPSVVLVGAAGAALVFGITHLRHEPLVEVRAVAEARAASPPSSRAQEPVVTALASECGGVRVIHAAGRFYVIWYRR